MIDNPRRLIYDLDYEELADVIRGWGEPDYRIEQIWHGIYRSLWSSEKEFSNLSLQLREKLSNEFEFSHLTPQKWIESADGETRKTLFELEDGSAIEAVLMRYHSRRTLCISSQAGCAMGCVFCATGQMGFRRNLTSGEIVEQVLFYARQLSSLGERVTNIVVMGMGEPFHNYDATMQAIDRMNDPRGLDFGSRRFTVSTVGIVPAIKRFTKEKRQVNLAISLHAADDQLRSTLLPINRKYNLKEILDACREYVDKTHRRITFEWALIQGVNDSAGQANALATLCKPFIKNGASLCHVNVIPLNPTEGYAGKATPKQHAYHFKSVLESRGIPCTVRTRRGIDIQAGCGQLAVK
jgi:23S rRNA (adenine2503-C2)-methyltransferase